MSPADHATRRPRGRSGVRPLAVSGVVVLVLLALLASACGGGSDGTIGSDADEEGAGADSAGAGGSSADGGSTTSITRSSTTEGDDTDTADDGATSDGAGPDEGLAAWAGRYLWEEVVDGNPGSNQVLVHELVLQAPAGDEAGDGGPITGQLSQSGFQTATELTVAAEPVADGIAIRVVSVDAGLTPMDPGDIAVTLTGSPADPVTTVGTLIPLVVDRPTSGRYFVPDRGATASGDDGDDGEGATGDGRPDTFWAIEARTFDLIQVDANTGDEVARITGWGAPPGGDPDLVLQALQRVDVSPDGWLWIDDCCEPAFGNVFGLDPDRVTALEQVFGSVDGPVGRQLVGLNPVTSPDGSFLAWGNGPFEVTVADDRGEPIGSVLAGDDETFAIPIAWLDATTVAAAVAGQDQTTITFWDVRTPSSPVQVGSPQVIPGRVADAARAEGGAILVVFGPQPVPDPARGGAMVSPTGIEIVDVPDGLNSIDRDASGRHLLWVGGDGLARVGPLTGDASVLSGIEVLWASW